MFVSFNGVVCAAPEAESAAAILALAAGEIDETGAAGWMRDRWHSVCAAHHIESF
jgi:death on curing protein